MWYHFAQQIPADANDHVYNNTDFSTGKSAYAFAALRSWQPQQQEMKKAGLHSSLLSPFFDDHDADHPHALPSTDPVYLDPYSEEYYETLVNTLDLDSPKYSNISEDVV